MTIETFKNVDPRMAQVETRSLEGLIEWGRAADAISAVAEKIAGTSFCPAAFKGKPDDVSAAILAGWEMDLSPMAALKAFDVIQGQVAPRAITLRAVVQSRGHQIEVVEQTASRAVVRGRRAGAAEWQESVWDMDRATAMGLTGKDNWKKQPGAMLVARATAECARLIAADAILGIPYAAEELEDGAYRVTDAPARVKVSQVEEAPAVEPLPSTADPITQKQLADIQAAMKAMSITGDDRLAVARALSGRKVGSPTDLTRDEADAILEGLAVVRGSDDIPGTVAKLVEEGQ